MMEDDMSHELDKEQHSKRIYQKETTIKRNVKLAKEYGIPVKQPHKLHKKSPFSCGNSDCVMCMNPRKSFGEKTMQERKFDQTANLVDE
jgi:hypothetical protein